MLSYSELVPPESRELYALVYIVEVGLRELCIDLLGQRYGPRFWREALPAELVERMRAGVARGRATGWEHSAPQHPLYELGLPDLLALLDSDALWMAVFRYHFRLRGTVTRWLGELVAARAILHANQPVGDHQLNAGRTAHYELETAMGGAALRCAGVWPTPPAPATAGRCSTRWRMSSTSRSAAGARGTRPSPRRPGRGSPTPGGSTKPFSARASPCSEPTPPPWPTTPACTPPARTPTPPAPGPIRPASLPSPPTPSPSSMSSGLRWATSNTASDGTVCMTAWQSNPVWNAAKPSAAWNFPLFSIGRVPALWAGTLPMELIGAFLLRMTHDA